jgi:hypothetical protein
MTLLLLALLAQMPALPATPETRWEFWAVMGYLTIQTLGQIYSKRQGDRIERQSARIEEQTNGLVQHQVDAATIAGHAQGEIAGVQKEQVRVAAKLALSNEVEAHLEEIKKHD